MTLLDELLGIRPRLPVGKKRVVLKTTDDRPQRRRILSRARTQRWRQAHPERVKTSTAAWRKRNPEKAREYRAKWNAANPLKRVAMYRRAMRKAYWKNPEKFRERQRKVRTERREHHLAMRRIWWAANRVRVNAENRAKAARLRAQRAEESA